MEQTLPALLTFQTADFTFISVLSVRQSSDFRFRTKAGGGYYVYASTTDILDRALKRLRIRKKSNVEIRSGEILKISADGAIDRSTFNNDEYDYPRYTYGRYFDDPYSDYTSEIDEIINFAAYFGFDESDIIMLLDLGYDAFEIEEMLYDPLSMRGIISEYRDMITCEYGE